MTKFLHTADWHIRDVQYGRAFRGEDFKRAIRNVLQQAEELGVDFIVNGGDTLHMNRPSETMIEFLCEIHETLLEMEIPMYTVTGNHDASAPSFLTLPNRLSKLGKNGSDRAGIVCIDNEIIEHDGIRIAGFPALPFTEMAEAMKTQKADIVVWHGPIEGFVPFAMKNSGLLQDLPLDSAAAWLLGDIHRRGKERLPNGALVSYPGPVEMCERGELAEKFVDLYRLDGDWRSAPFPEPFEVPIDVRPAIFLNVGDDAEADQALAKIRKTINENPGRSPLIFCRYEKSQKPFVNRVNEIIDPRDTVFRAASYSSTYKGMVAAGVFGQRPRLIDVADEVVPPGSPIHGLTRSLIASLEDGAEDEKYTTSLRHQIVTWTESELEKARAAAATL